MSFNKSSLVPGCDSLLLSRIRSSFRPSCSCQSEAWGVEDGICGEITGRLAALTPLLLLTSTALMTGSKAPPEGTTPVLQWRKKRAEDKLKRPKLGQFTKVT